MMEGTLDDAHVGFSNSNGVRRRMLRSGNRSRSTNTWFAAAFTLLTCTSDMVNAFCTSFVPRSTATTFLVPTTGYLFNKYMERRTRSIPTNTRSYREIPISCLNALKSEDSTEKCSELEFEMFVGKALDTLRSDYQDLLVKDPDYSLYARDMELVDPSGVSVHGLRAYQNAFRLLHTLIKFLYCLEKSAMTNVRMYYCPVKRNIRIHWNAEIVPREIFRGTQRVLRVDGISVYEFDRNSGDIVQHRLEHLIMNNGSVRPKEGVVAALSRYHGATVPFLIQRQQQETIPSITDIPGDIFRVNFSPMLYKGQPSIFSSNDDGGSYSPSPLNSMEASRSEGDDAGVVNGPDINWDALESKNKSRKKFGLEPLTPEEFLQLESTVKVMDMEQKLKMQQQQAATKEVARNQKRGRGLLDKVFGSVLQDTCESNFDCERPLVCCDFVFKKMCCSSGSPVLGQPQWQPATVPVPVGIEDFPKNRPPPRY